MIVELIISKDRVPYLVEGLGANRVTVSDYDESTNKVVFEQISPLDVLYVFHAGVKYGSDSMSKALLNR
jgi:hypothetical protein